MLQSRSTESDTVRTKPLTSSLRKYWVIAPYYATRPESFERVWAFDIANNLISVGWAKLGDISSLDENALEATIDRTYPNAPTKTLLFNMLWNFYHSISVGDIIIARRGIEGRRK